VDDVDGTAHRKYGGMPNSVHIVNPDGVVLMRGDRNDVQTVKKVLEHRDKNGIYKRDVYRGRPVFFTQKRRPESANRCRSTGRLGFHQECASTRTDASEERVQK